MGANLAGGFAGMGANLAGGFAGVGANLASGFAGGSCRWIVPVDCAGGLCQWIALVDLSVKQILAESGERRTRCELAQSQRKVSTAA